MEWWERLLWSLLAAWRSGDRCGGDGSWWSVYSRSGQIRDKDRGRPNEIAWVFRSAMLFGSSRIRRSVRVLVRIPIECAGRSLGVSDLFA